MTGQEVDATFWREPLSALCAAALAAGTFERRSSRPDFLVLGLHKPD